MNNSSRSKNNCLIGDLDKTFCNFISGPMYRKTINEAFKQKCQSWTECLYKTSPYINNFPVGYKNKNVSAKSPILFLIF